SKSDTGTPAAARWLLRAVRRGVRYSSSAPGPSRNRVPHRSIVTALIIVRSRDRLVVLSRSCAGIASPSHSQLCKNLLTLGRLEGSTGRVIVGADAVPICQN